MAEDDDVFLLDNLAALNWHEVSLLLNEVEQNKADFGLLGLVGGAVGEPGGGAAVPLPGMGPGAGGTAGATSSSAGLGSDAPQAFDARSVAVKREAPPSSLEIPMPPQSNSDIMAMLNGMGAETDELGAQGPHMHAAVPPSAPAAFAGAGAGGGAGGGGGTGTETGTGARTDAVPPPPSPLLRTGSSMQMGIPLEAMDQRVDPAMGTTGALEFADVHELLMNAHASDTYDPSIRRRYGVSPVNPKGPRRFYVVHRNPKMRNVDNLYTESSSAPTYAVRLRSTKKLHWINECHGLQYRELAKKERKSGNALEFGGCLYTLAVRTGPGTPPDMPNPKLQFLQVWDLSLQRPQRKAGKPLKPGSAAARAAVAATATKAAAAANVSAAATEAEGGLGMGGMGDMDELDLGLGRLEGLGRLGGLEDGQGAPLPGAALEGAPGLGFGLSAPQQESGSGLEPVADPRKRQTLDVAAGGSEGDSERAMAMASAGALERRSPSSASIAVANAVGTADEVEQVVYEIFNRHCENLQPAEWKLWTEKYHKFLMSDDFAKILHVYVTRLDPRLKETFLFPNEIVPGLPLGVFRATVDEDISANGGTCVFCDEVFAGMVGQNPLGMKGFFVSILSPLQRLVTSRVWWKRMSDAQQNYIDFFADWKITQGAYTLHDGTVKVLRTKNRLYADDEHGMTLVECVSQDVSHLYPEILALPPFLA